MEHYIIVFLVDNNDHSNKYYSDINSEMVKKLPGHIISSCNILLHQITSNYIKGLKQPK